MDDRFVLVIEDSPTQAKFTARTLEKAGHRVSIAATARAGIDLAHTGLYDVILLDVNLPDMDGFEVCRQLRQTMTNYVPILLFTGERIAVKDKVDGLSIGADDYLIKPFDPRELQARVAALLRIKIMLDDLFTRLTDERTSYERLRRIALTDQLTTVFNRHYLQEVLDREFGMARRYQTPLACIMADIDLFREFNNQYGHVLGDWVLRNTAILMKDNLRQGDLIARFGGEEFICVLPHSTAVEAAQMAERLRQIVDGREWESPAGKLHISLSFGVAALPYPGMELPEHLITFADRALYQAKAQGRNRVEIYSDQKAAPDSKLPGS